MLFISNAFWILARDRLLVEEIDYNILFRWFVGLNLDDEVWDATVFTKNRNRLLEAEVAKEFLALVVEQARGQGWASDEHFTVDGSLLEVWASVKPLAPSVDTQNCRSVGSRSIGLDELRVATSPRGKAEYAPLDGPGPSNTLSDAKILIAGGNTLRRRSRSMSRSNPLL